MSTRKRRCIAPVAVELRLSPFLSLQLFAIAPTLAVQPEFVAQRLVLEHLHFVLSRSTHSCKDLLHVRHV